MAIFVKDPGATVDYAVDWAAALVAGQSITVSRWQVEPEGGAGLSVAASAIIGTRCVATLQGGVAGLVYRVANLVTFSDGRRDQRQLAVRVEVR